MWRLLKGDFTAMGGQAGTIANALAELPVVLKETESVGKARMVIADADYGVGMADWDKDPWPAETFAHAVQVGPIVSTKFVFAFLSCLFDLGLASLVFSCSFARYRLHCRSSTTSGPSAPCWWSSPA